MANLASYDNSKRSAAVDQQHAQTEGWIRAKNLVKSFKNGGVSINVLQGVGLNLSIGESVAIVGASGIGKSTLLHILGTLDRPDSGTLEFKGEDVFQFDDVKLAQFRNQTIGFVFQFHHLLSEFSALENTMMPALISGLSKTEAAALAEESMTVQTYHFSSKVTHGESLMQQTISDSSSYAEAVDGFRKRFIQQVLAECGGNRHEAARRLRMNRPNLLKLMKRLGIGSEGANGEK